MGSIVIQRAIESGAWPQQAPLYSHVVLFQPDADGHSVWLEQLGRRESVLCTLNADDRVLQRSNDDRAPGARALGLGAPDPLAANAKYIDLTGMGALGEADDDHEVLARAR